MSAPTIDPRLIAAEPGLRGAVRDVRRKIAQGEIGNLPVLLGLVGVWLYFWSANDRFLSANNLTNLMLQLAAGGTIAIGVVLVLLLGEIDLSVGATSGLAAAVMVVTNTDHGWPAGLAMLAALATGAAVGLIQGIWITKFHVPAFIVTLAGLLAWTGALLRVLGRGGSRNINTPGILRLASTFYGSAVTWTIAVVIAAGYVALTLHGRRRRRAAGLVLVPMRNVVLHMVTVVGAIAIASIVFGRDRGLPLLVLIFLVLVASCDLMLRRTRFGRHIFAVGGNAEAARRAGIAVTRVRLTVFVMASTLAAAGGVLAASRLTAVTQSSGGNDILLNAVAAAVIGGTSLFGGRGSSWSALLGSLVIFSVINGMTLLNKTSDVRYIVTGIVLLLAVTIDAVARRGRASAGRA